MNPQWEDPYLLRFLRARKFNIKDTQKMWFDFIEWRHKNGVDQLGVFALLCRPSSSPNSQNYEKYTPTATTNTTGKYR